MDGWEEELFHNYLNCLLLNYVLLAGGFVTVSGVGGERLRDKLGKSGSLREEGHGVGKD